MMMIYVSSIVSYNERGCISSTIIPASNEIFSLNSAHCMSWSASSNKAPSLMERVRRIWFIGICENEDIAAENSGNDTMMIDDDDDDAHCVDLIESEAVTNEGQD